MVVDLEPGQLADALQRVERAAAEDLAQMPNELQATWTVNAARCARYWLHTAGLDNWVKLTDAGSMASDSIDAGQLGWLASWQGVRMRRRANAAGG